MLRRLTGGQTEEGLSERMSGIGRACRHGGPGMCTSEVRTWEVVPCSSSPESYGDSLNVFTWGIMCSGLNFKITLVAALRRGQSGGPGHGREENPDVFAVSRGQGDAAESQAVWIELSRTQKAGRWSTDQMSGWH